MLLRDAYVFPLLIQSTSLIIGPCLCQDLICFLIYTMGFPYMDYLGVVRREPIPGRCRWAYGPVMTPPMQGLTNI